MIDTTNVREFFVDSVSLEPIESLDRHAREGYLDFLPSADFTRKSQQEMAWWRRDQPVSVPEKHDYRNRYSWLDHPDTNDSSVILDLGCGPFESIGLMPARMRYAIDDLMGAYCEELGFRSDLITPVSAKSELLPVPSDSVDVLYSINMLDHVDDMVATTKEMYRVLKPEGCVVFQCYFNSPPLLPPEPGVVDREFVSTVLSKYFDTSKLTAYAKGDRRVPHFFIADVIGGIMTKRAGAAASDPHLEPGGRVSYIHNCIPGPNAKITHAMLAIERGDLSLASGIVESLPDLPQLNVHRQLLRSSILIHEGQIDRAEGLLTELASSAATKDNARLVVAIQKLKCQALAKRVALMKQSSTWIVGRALVKSGGFLIEKASFGSRAVEARARRLIARHKSPRSE